MLDSLMKVGSYEKADRNEKKRPPEGGPLLFFETGTLLLLSHRFHQNNGSVDQ